MTAAARSRPAKDWLEARALTAQGPFRDTNEDVAFARTESGLFVVADGVGGRPLGERAAALTAEMFARACRGRPSRTRLSEVFRAVNNALYRESIERGLPQPMAAVATVAWIDAESHSRAGVIGHIGDTRALLFDEDGAGCQLTRDQAAIDADAVPESQTLAAPGRNVIASALGLEPWRGGGASSGRVELKRFHFEPGHTLVLVSDGVSDYLDRARTSAVVAEHGRSAEALAEALVAASVEAQNAAGKGDNIGVVVVRSSKREEERALRESKGLATSIGFGVALGLLAAGGIQTAAASHSSDPVPAIASALSGCDLGAIGPVAITLGSGAKVTLDKNAIVLEGVEVHIDLENAVCAVPKHGGTR